MRVNIVTNISNSQLVDKGSGIWQIRGIPMTVDDAVMNGVLYDKDENIKGLNSYRGKPVALSHPVDDDGNPTTAMEGVGLFANYSGGVIVNTYNHNGVNYADAEFNIGMMEKQQGGEWYANQIKEGKPIGVSTGLTFEDNKISGTNACGDEYHAKAINQRGDHLALLPDSKQPAGGSATMIKFNGQEGVSELTVNIDNHIDSLNESRDMRSNRLSLSKLINMLVGRNEERPGFRLITDKIERKLKESISEPHTYVWVEELYDDYFVYESPDGILMKQDYTLSDGNDVEFTGVPVKVTKKVKYFETNNGDDAMREKMIAALAAKGITVNSGISDDELLAKYGELNKQKDPNSPVSDDVTTALNSIVEPLISKIKSLETAVNAGAEKELEELAKQASEVTGISVNALKELGREELHKTLAKHGVTVGAPVNAQNKHDQDDSNMNLELPE
jgi:hypothetical protein